MRHVRQKNSNATKSHGMWLIVGSIILTGLVVAMSQNTSGHSATMKGVRSTQMTEHPVALTLDDVGLRLEEFLANHPIVSLSTNFYQEVMSGQIKVDWTTTRDAAFVLIPKDMCGSRCSKALTPFLFVNPQMILGNTDYANLVIFHEYIHYRQWKTKRIPEEAFVFAPIDLSNPRKICTEKWYAEREAYHKECEFAQKAGTASLESICADMDSASFDAKLLSAMVRGDSNAKVCAPYWKK